MPSPRPHRSRAARRKSLLVWLFGLAALGLLLTLSSNGLTPLDRLSPLVFDAYQRIQPRAETGAPVTIVDIDEASIAELGQWPWSRALLGKIVDRLGELGAATIAFDIVFPEPDRTSLTLVAAELRAAGATVDIPPTATMDNDAAFAAAIARNYVVSGIVISDETRAPLPAPKAGFSYGGSDPLTYLSVHSGGAANLSAIDAAAQGTGFFSFFPETDGIVRKLPLVAAAQGRLYPSLGIEALRVAQDAKNFTIRSSDASGEVAAGGPAMAAMRVGAMEVPTGADGEFWLYFSGLPSMVTIPAAALLDPERSAAFAERIAGHVVLIGTSAVGLRDIVATPTDASLPGVRVHAELIDQVLGQTFLSRPDWARGAEIFAAVVLGLMLVAVAQQGAAIRSAIAAVILLAVALALSWFGFSHYRLLLDPLLPAGAVALVFIVTMPLLLLLTDRERQFVRGAFGRYLSPQLVERLGDNPGALKLGGELRDLTILFSDIRGFTGLSEKLKPDELTELLNSFLTPMTDVLLRSDATIDKYMGDAIMAFWNAPLDIADHPRKACLATLEMLAGLEALNRQRGSDLRIGIGLHSGPTCVGNLGSAQRFSYSAIGDSVNLASRVEGQTKGYGVAVLVTEATRAAASDLAFLEVDLVRVVGRAEPVPLHTLLGDAAHAQTPQFRRLAEAHARLIIAYRAADLDQVEAALVEARQLGGAPLEKLYDLYAERLANMRTETPAPDWDGVFTARQK